LAEVDHPEWNRRLLERAFHIPASSKWPWRIGSANTKLGVAKHVAALLVNAMALGPGLVLAAVAGSAFCPLTRSRRLLSFAEPTRQGRWITHAHR
jgi:hypothetical protein